MTTKPQDQLDIEAYDMVDRFLRNNLDDFNYAEYSKALDELARPAPEALGAAKGELSDAEIEAVWNGLGYRTKYTAYLRDFARAILAKAKDQS